MRHVNVVVVSCVNELSLLRGFLGCFFLGGLFSGLLLSCHIWFLSFSGFPSHDHKILCWCSSCGLEKTAHNMLLYKLKWRQCQQINSADKKIYRRIHVSKSVLRCVRWPCAGSWRRVFADAEDRCSALVEKTIEWWKKLVKEKVVQRNNGVNIHASCRSIP